MDRRHRVDTAATARGDGYSKLPPALVGCIFAFLDAFDAPRVAKASRTWYQAARGWRPSRLVVDISSGHSGHLVDERLGRFCAERRDIRARWTDRWGARLEFLRVRNVPTLALARLDMDNRVAGTDAVLHGILRRWASSPKLRRLDLGNWRCPLWRSEKCDAAVFSSATSLTHLNMPNESFLDSTTARRDREAIAIWMAALSELREFAGFCPAATNREFIDGILPHWNRLERLHVNFWSAVNKHELLDCIVRLASIASYPALRSVRLAMRWLTETESNDLEIVVATPRALGHLCAERPELESVEFEIPTVRWTRTRTAGQSHLRVSTTCPAKCNAFLRALNGQTVDALDIAPGDPAGYLDEGMSTDELGYWHDAFAACTLRPRSFTMVLFPSAVLRAAIDTFGAAIEVLACSSSTLLPTGFLDKCPRLRALSVILPRPLSQIHWKCSDTMVCATLERLVLTPAPLRRDMDDVRAIARGAFVRHLRDKDGTVPHDLFMSFLRMGAERCWDASPQSLLVERLRDSTALRRIELQDYHGTLAVAVRGKPAGAWVVTFAERPSPPSEPTVIRGNGWQQITDPAGTSHPLFHFDDDELAAFRSIDASHA